MMLSSFYEAPCVGHLECAKKVHNYLSKLKNDVIRIITNELDMSGLPDQQ